MKYKRIIVFLVIAFMLCTSKIYVLENKNVVNNNQIFEKTATLLSTKVAIVAADAAECDSLFGTMDQDGKGGNKLSIRYLVNEILTYVRIIVPILVIGLGMIDLAKAVISGKEDEMKKAQKTFALRVVAGVAVFFVPAIVNVVMWIADKTWVGLGYGHCSLQ